MERRLLAATVIACAGANAAEACDGVYYMEICGQITTSSIVSSAEPYLPAFSVGDTWCIDFNIRDVTDPVFLNDPVFLAVPNADPEGAQFSPVTLFNQGQSVYVPFNDSPPSTYFQVFNDRSTLSGTVDQVEFYSPTANENFGQAHIPLDVQFVFTGPANTFGFPVVLDEVLPALQSMTAEINIMNPDAGTTASVASASFTQYTYEMLQIPCPADLNRDNVATVGDILDFLSLWSNGISDRADINKDGFYTVGDILDYLAIWAEGCSEYPKTICEIEEAD